MSRKYPLKYYIDSSKIKIRRRIKSQLPQSIIRRIDRSKVDRSYYDAMRLIVEDVPPWSSPNIWNKIVKYYSEIDGPVIFEYGTGASTLHHVSYLVARGGTYIGVEKDERWFWIVVSALVKKLSKASSTTFLVTKKGHEIENSMLVEITADHGNAILRLSASSEEYISALNRKCDLVIVDGAFRKECIRWALATNYLHEGGLLVLMEAGRGSKDWWEGKLSGEKDYRDEVNLMLEMGGKMMDGDGLDTWENCNRSSPPPPSYLYPLEACFLEIPGGQKKSAHKYRSKTKNGDKHLTEEI